MASPLLAMEEHHQAYFAWKQAGIRQAWCWHVDAHLDVGRDGLGPARLKELAGCASLAEAEAAGLCGNAYLPWGGLHCGNYLYPAILEGIVSRLTWVIPPHLVTGRLLDWSRAHLDGWLDMTVAETAALVEENGCVRGTLLGIPFELGTLANLGIPDGPVLLDVDIDYFLDETASVWQEPQVLADVQSLFTTVAYSVKGGYTPTGQRHLARVWCADTDGYRATPLDEAAALVNLRDYTHGLERLAALPADVVSGYLLGTCHHHLGHFEEALETWLRLLAHSDLVQDGKAYVGGLCSEVLCRLGRYQEALDFARDAQREVEPDYRLLWVEAAAQEQLGDLRGATQTIRRGLRLAEPYLFGLQMRLVLAQLYRKQGKQGLASLELASLERHDLLGQLRPLTLLR